ncbi:MAG TPA: hypothetical protein VFU21_04740 [Kofleriaceae bacterium]|nr:hypothetical protein [Kofleriaceae bacterium]
MKAAVLLVALAAGAGAARAQPRAMDPEARAHLERGLRAYAERQWEAAVEELRAGYQIDPHPDFLFPWAQALRRSGDCAGALPLYRRALSEAAGAEDRADIERLIAGCEEEVERERPPPPEPSPPVEARPRPPVEVHARSAAPPAWYTDRLGAGLAIGGAVGIATGAGFLFAAGRAEADADSAADLEGFVDASDRADQRRLVGAIALGAGAGLAAAAALRYAWVARRSEPRVVVAPLAGGGAAVALGASF